MRLFFLSLMLAVSLLTGCGHTGSTNGVKAVGRVSLQWDMCRKFNWCPMLLENTNPSLFTMDSLYVLPSQPDMDDLLKFYQKRKEPLPYVTDGHDCDDFARAFMHWAGVWSQHRYGRPKAAVAVGVAWVALHGDISDLFPGDHEHRTAFHVINVILREDGQWFFFEPQSRALSKVESMLYEGSLTISRIEL